MLAKVNQISYQCILILFKKSLPDFNLNSNQIRSKTTLVSPINLENLKSSPRIIGQPTSQTHPHLLKPGEIVAGIQLTELQERRAKLAKTVLKYASETKPNIKNHLVSFTSLWSPIFS